MADTAHRVAVGASWLYGFRWTERILDFISVIVLARLLAPDDFGLFAIAASFVAIIEGLSAFDVHKALIRSRDDDRALYDTAWTLSAMRGIVAAIAMVVIAQWLRDDRLAEVLMVLAISPLLSGLANPRFVMFERDMVFSKLAFLTLGAKVATFGVTLAVAILYRTYWALALGMIAGTVVSTIASYGLRPYRPRATLTRFEDIFAFSGWLTLTSIVTTLSMETDKIIVGRLLGVTDAGRYFMTQKVGVLPTRELVSPLQRVLFPSFSELAGEKTRLRRVVRESVNVLGSISIPAGIGFALIANDFVPLVLGEQWRSLVPLLRILVPYLGLRATLSITLPCVMALGETRRLFWVSFVYALIHVPAFVAGTALFGLSGSIWSLALAGIFYSYLNAWLLRQMLGLSPWELAGQLKRPLVSAGVMVVTLWLLTLACPFNLFSESGSWPSLWTKTGIGAAAFGATQYALWHLAGRPEGIEQRLRQMVSRD